jgi:hypothetical protein
MVPAYGASPRLWLVAGLVHGQQPAIAQVRYHTLEPSVQSRAPDDGHNSARNMLSVSQVQ